MLLGQVIGNATSTVKHSSLEGSKLLVIQPLNAERQADGDPVLAVDRLGAAVGHDVLLSSDGRSARELLGVEATPLRWTTIGVMDPAHDAEPRTSKKTKKKKPKRS